MVGTVYEESRFILQEFLTKAVRDAIVYSRKFLPLLSTDDEQEDIDLDASFWDRLGVVEHCNRKTVMTMDVIYALKLQGRTLYYF